MTPSLAAVLDCILPGSAGFPSASQAGLAPQAGAGVVMETLLARLPRDFAALPREDQVACLKRLEAEDRTAFGQVVATAYEAYYATPAVVAAIERTTGYVNRPPLPQGYRVPPLDPHLLDKPRQRAPHYREP